jgi:hypothetical protein
VLDQAAEGSGFQFGAFLLVHLVGLGVG